MSAPAKSSAASAPPAPHAPVPPRRAARPLTLTYKETAALCGISRMTLWRWRTQEGLSFTRGRITPGELVRWLVHREGLAAGNER